MDIKTYKLNKIHFNELNSDKNIKRRDYCYNCLRPKKACFCSNIKPFQTETKFIILIHPKEAKKNRIGTGRLSHLILKNSEMVMDINFNENERFQELISDNEYHHVLLYPGKDHMDIGNGDIQKKYAINEKLSKPLCIYILDATWPCAKKMMSLSTCLHDMPRVSFTTSRKSEFYIKHQPHESCLSTIESIHEVLVNINNVGIENIKQKNMEKLLYHFNQLVEYQIKCATDDTLPSYRGKKDSQNKTRCNKVRPKTHRLFYLET